MYHLRSAPQGYAHKFGPLGFATTVGLELNATKNDSVLIYCSIFDRLEWVVTDSGIPRDEVTAIRSLDGFPDPTICGETFAASVGFTGCIWRRGFISTHWEKVLDIGVGLVNVVRTDQQGGNVWAGGETAIFAPWIAKSMDKGENWEISYFDVHGELVRLLVGRVLNAGRHQVKWDGKNENDQLVSSGVYFCRLQIGTVRQVRKLSLLR